MIAFICMIDLECWQLTDVWKGCHDFLKFAGDIDALSGACKPIFDRFTITSTEVGSEYQNNEHDEQIRLIYVPTAWFV